jgi:hypothetical protein
MGSHEDPLVDSMFKMDVEAARAGAFTSLDNWRRSFEKTFFVRRPRYQAVSFS